MAMLSFLQILSGCMVSKAEMSHQGAFFSKFGVDRKRNALSVSQSVSIQQHPPVFTATSWLTLTPDLVYQFNHDIYLADGSSVEILPHRER